MRQTVKEPPITQEPIKSSKVKTAVKRITSLPSGEFSITRFIMIFGSIFSFSLIPVGALAYLLYDKVLPDNLYTYAATLAGSGIVQYGATKFFNSKQNNNK